MQTDREKALAKLLSPIVWDWSSSIRARQNLVVQRHNAVNNAYPFMSEDEQAKARAWAKEEAHSGLWD